MKSLKFVANWWQINCVHLILDTMLTISFLVSDISLESFIKVKIFLAVVHIIHMGGIVLFSELFLWRKFVLFTNESNSRYGYNLTIRKIAFVWYYEVLYVPPLAGEHIAFSSLDSIIFYDFGLPEISLIFIQLSLW